MYRKHRERQAAAAGGPNGRAHSSDSLQEEDYGDYSFSDYQAAGPSLPEGGEEEDMEGGEEEEEEEMEDEEGQESKAGLQQMDQRMTAAASSGLYSLGHEAATKLIGRPQIQLSHVR